ncbi:hypothetical protein ACFQX8_09785 [Klenkia terrae]|uniref:hypothetical protein n=1 Tax=Klenkia terrae TaxID=1052259 RepID=UPI00361357EE
MCCGLTWISTGQLDTARSQLARTVAALDLGVPVVGLEPSCTAVLRGDAVELVPGPAAQRVVAATHTLAELLATKPGWTPPDLTGVRGVAQPHCHQHAVLGWAADRDLLARAGAEVAAVGGAAGWPATSGPRPATTPCRWRWRRPRCCPPSGRPGRVPPSWPTGSPAAPSSTSWPASGPGTWPRCWPREWAPTSTVER